MSETKHTPEKWEWTDKYVTDDGRPTWTLINNDNYGILSCDGVANSPQGLGDLANSLLIAKAPEILTALETEVKYRCLHCREQRAIVACEHPNANNSVSRCRIEKYKQLIAEAKVS